MKWNYLLHEWIKIVTCTIFKEHGNIMIYKLRIIHIYKADLSTILTTKWKSFTHNLLLNNLFYQGLGTTVPIRTFHDPVLNPTLQWKISKLNWSTLVKGESDMTTYYDRTLPCLASAISQLIGMPRTVCLVNANTLQ